MKITISNICSAFSPSTIGSRVLNHSALLAVVEQSIATHDLNKDRITGQHSIQLPAEACQYVSAGVGKRTTDPEDYVLRVQRGRVDCFLKREKAAVPDSVTVIVYSQEAYLMDPDVQKDGEEVARVQNSDCTHVIVAVLAAAGPKSPLTPHRFTENLAGSNREALEWSADEIRNRAQQISTYYAEWSVVAD